MTDLANNSALFREPFWTTALASNEKDMANHKSSSFGEHVPLLIATVLLLGFGIGFMKYGTHFWESLGHAFIVAVILLWTVDLYFKKQLVQDAAKYIFTWSMPQKARESMHEYLTPSNYKENYIVELTLTLEKGGGKIRYSVRETYDVFNYTTKRQQYSPRIQFDRHENPVQESITLEVRGIENGKCWKNRDIIDKIRIDRGIISFNPDTNYSLSPVSPVDQSRKPSCTVVWEYALILPLEYSPIITATMPTIGTTVVVKWPEDKIEFGCETDENTLHTEGSKTWIYDRLFLKKQYVRVWWWLKNK